MANNKKLQELDGMNGVPLVDADIVHGVTQTGGQPTDKKITVKELSDHAETHVKANAAHASEQEDTDQAKLATVGKVEEMISEIDSGGGSISIDTAIDPANPSTTKAPSSKAVVDYVEEVLPNTIELLGEPIVGSNILLSDNVNDRKLNKKYNTTTGVQTIGAPVVYESNSSYNTTGRIPVIGGATYYFKGINSAIMFYLDEDENLISRQSGMSSVTYHEVTIPASAVSMRISYPKTQPIDGEGCICVTYGERRYATKESTGLALDMDESNKVAEQVLSGSFETATRQVVPTHLLNMELIRERIVADHSDDYWRGKKMFVDGDSISDYIGNQPFWQQHVANNLRMEFITVGNIPKSYSSSNDTFSIGNKGFGGTRLCPCIEEGSPTGTTQPPRVYSPRERCLVRRIAEGYYDNVNADLFIIFVGTNDWNHIEDVGGKLGSIDDAPFAPTKDTPATEDTEATKGTWTLMDERDKDGQINLEPYVGITFYGCLKYLVEWFIMNKPKADLVLVTPIKRDNNVGGDNHIETSRSHHYAEMENGIATTKTQMLKLSDYAKAIKEVGELYGVPVCDLFSNCFMNPSTDLGQDKNYPTTESAENIAKGTQLTRYFDYYNGTGNKRDTTHPGPEGHKKIGRLVTGFLKSLC